MMRPLLSLLRRLRADRAGSMAIETAIVTPVLVIMALGGFEASSMVARQSELQSAVAEAAAIAMAAPPQTHTDVQNIRAIIESSTGLGDNNVTVYRLRKCGTHHTYLYFSDSCSSGDKNTTYLYIYITDTYTPKWVDFGIGSPVNYNVQRTVEIS
jgi:Flp pilus assembly protein TadG